MPGEPISVLIVDDSAVVRVTLRTLLSAETDIGRVDVARDPYVAADRIHEHVPDVIILDMQMPRMDGLTFLRKLMEQHPIPVVVCSAYVEEGSREALEALESGAVDVIAKPAVGARQFLEESRAIVADAVRAAAAARVTTRTHATLTVTPRLTADAVLPPRSKRRGKGRGERIVAVGASTGGTEALHAILQPLPVDVPSIVVAQHMPAHFTAELARSLDRVCLLTVKEARNGETVLPGHVYIAPGDRHTTVRRGRGGYKIAVVDGPRVNRHRPSVDVLFRSVACDAGSAAVGVLLTGMGDDGAAGLLELREAGAHTIAQDEQSSVVFGMPAAAIKRGAAEEVLALRRIAERILALTRA
jgi:two-component system chemotaxis response regulator CheB